MPPGQTQFTRIPKGPSSMAVALENPRTAHLLEQYAERVDIPCRPAVEETLTIAPPPVFIVRATALVPSMVPLRFTSMTSEKELEDISSTGSDRMIPALLTRPAICPQRVTARDTTSSQPASSRTSSLNGTMLGLSEGMASVAIS